MLCEAGDRDTDTHRGAREDRQRPRERPALTVDVQSAGLGGINICSELPRLRRCHSQPMQTHPSATMSLGALPAPSSVAPYPG